MGSTYLSLHFHIVFSTKNREARIVEGWRDRLHEYLGGTARGLEGIPQAIGGVEDHVHLLVGLRATHTLADFVREVKKAGTLWVHEQKLDPEFSWQEGYATFTVSPPACPSVAKYVFGQAEHHRRRNSMDELKWLLKKAGLAYDPRYLE